MTAIRAGEWIAGILGLLIIYSVLRGSVWESEEERREDLAELRRSIGQDKGD